MTLSREVMNTSSHLHHGRVVLFMYVSVTDIAQQQTHAQPSRRNTYLQLSQSEIIQKLHTFSCHSQKSFKGYIPSAVTVRNHSKVTYLQLSQSEIIQRLHTFSCHSQKSFKGYIPPAVTVRNHSKVTYLQLSQSEIIQKLHTFSCHNQKSFKSYIPPAVTIRNHSKVTYLQLSTGRLSLVQLTLILRWSDLIEARERQFTAWSS